MGNISVIGFKTDDEDIITGWREFGWKSMPFNEVGLLLTRSQWLSFFCIKRCANADFHSLSFGLVGFTRVRVS